MSRSTASVVPVDMDHLPFVARSLWVKQEPLDRPYDAPGFGGLAYWSWRTAFPEDPFVGGTVDPDVPLTANRVLGWYLRNATMLKGTLWVPDGSGELRPTFVGRRHGVWGDELLLHSDGRSLGFAHCYKGRVMSHDVLQVSTLADITDGTVERRYRFRPITSDRHEKGAVLFDLTRQRIAMLAGAIDSRAHAISIYGDWHDVEEAYRLDPHQLGFETV